MWQSILRAWAMQQLKEKAVEAVRAAQEQGGAPPAPEPQPTPDERSHEAAAAPDKPARPHVQPADAGIVFALSQESGGFEDLLNGRITTRANGIAFHEGGLFGRRVVAAVGGAGAAAARKTTEALVAGHRPAWVISAGFSGGLVQRVKKFDLILADGFVDLRGERLELDLQFSADGMPQTSDLHVGHLAQADRIVSRPSDKRSLGAQTGSLAVDLESFSVARTCERLGARFLAIRVISDAVNDELPPEIDRLARQTSRAGQLGAAAGALFRKPSSIKQMLALKQDALAASDKLAKFLSNLIRYLPKAAREDA